MGSRIMHLIIADKIRHKINITDPWLFLLGGVAPDAEQPKDRSHFYVNGQDNITCGIGYDLFINKYRPQIHNDFMLGYLCHLVADDLWLKSFYLEWLRERIEKQPVTLERYHQDFKILNGILLEWYSNFEMKQLLKDSNDGIIVMDELNIESVIKLKIDVHVPLYWERNSPELQLRK